MIRFSFVLAVAALAACGVDGQGTPEQDSECPRVCFLIYDPVCAQCADGTLRTFGNECNVESNNLCDAPDNQCRIVCDGECPAPPTPPPNPCQNRIACTREYEPVCGHCSDGKRIFSNACTLTQFNCDNPGADCYYLNDGACPSEHNTSTEPPSKPNCAAILCANTYDPVCAVCNGSTTETFPNGCLLYVHNCFNNDECVLEHKGVCTSGYPEICSALWDPVCANCLSGLRTFPNECYLEVNQAEYPEDYCDRQYNGACQDTCPIAYKCSTEYNPVCALCGGVEHTFTNDCILRSYNCENNFPCVKISEGRCTQPPLFCTDDYTPVCGRCMDGIQTFPNSCNLLRRNQDEPDAQCVQIGEGECCENCPLVNCFALEEPVCGQCCGNNITFENSCFFSDTNCRSNYQCVMLAETCC